MRRFVVWGLVLPLLLAGTEVAHALAYRIAYPVASVRWQMLATSGHGYLTYAPLVLGLGVAILVVSLASTVVDAARGRPTQALPAWSFATLPLLAFTAQEFSERVLSTSSLPWWMVEQPTFRIGVLLQLPFAVFAYLTARVLLRTSTTVGRLLGGTRHVWIGVEPPAGTAPHATRLRTVTSGGCSVRGPPLPTG